MIEALWIGEGWMSRSRSSHDINRSVRRAERPHEMQEFASTLRHMVHRDLIVVDRGAREFEESNGVASAQIEATPESNYAKPSLAPAEHPEVNDVSQKPGDMLYETEDTRSRIKIASIATMLSVLAIFLVSQGHERATEILTWPIASAAEYEAQVTGEDNVKVRYEYGINGTHITDWRNVAEFDDKRRAESLRKSINSRIRSGNPSHVNIRYNPENPGKSSFRMAVGSRLRWIITPIIIAALAFTGLIGGVVGLAELSGRKRKADAKINGPILNRILVRRALRADRPPRRKPQVRIKNRILKGLCRLSLHVGAWEFLNKGECSQLRECERCQALNIRTKHRPLWRYIGDRTCERNRVCSRCDAVGLQDFEHASWSNIGEGMEKCDRCGTETEISDGD